MKVEGEEQVQEGSEEIEIDPPAEGEEPEVEEEPAKASGRLAEGGEAGEEGGEGGADGERARPKKTSKQRRDERKRTERLIREERDFYQSQYRDVLSRLNEIEATGLDSRMLVVDGRLNECLNDAAQAESLEMEALKAGNTQEVIQFRKVREAANGKANLFRQEKERLAQAQAQRTSRKTTPAPTPGAAEVAAHAARYRADKAWLQFDQSGAPLNAETAVALSIDAALKREGDLNEREADYWQELDKRVRSALPRLFGEPVSGDADDDEDDEPVEPVIQQPTKAAPARAAAAASGRKGPAVGSSGSQQAAGPTYRLSKERIEALKEIGEWDTPEQRKSWAKHYQQWDKEHS
jgi:hypothetical protein